MSFFSLHALLRLKKKNFFFCHIHNYTEYNQQWHLCSAFNPSKCTHTWSSGQLTLQLGVWCLAQGSHLSLRQFLPELRFEPTTSGYKSNALSIRPRLPLGLIERLRFLIRDFLRFLRFLILFPLFPGHPCLVNLCIWSLSTLFHFLKLHVSSVSEVWELKTQAGNMNGSMLALAEIHCVRCRSNLNSSHM